MVAANARERFAGGVATRCTDAGIIGLVQSLIAESLGAVERNAHERVVTLQLPISPETRHAASIRRRDTVCPGAVLCRARRQVAPALGNASPFFDTFQEIAAAFNNEANFATNVYGRTDAADARFNGLLTGTLAVNAASLVLGSRKFEI
ncbi:hypothetical protein T492DRAFT_832737 [Pavlovales sp. CCMP2436]|nr:hypothetical protein T492DRAFT_832737 [Pavlovales sp. CCMP2436]